MAEDSTFEIYFIDVGQGDAACVLCDGEAMLIDGGGKSASSRMYGFLQSHDIAHLAYIVASHPDADHVGGLAGALNFASVDKAYCTVDEYDSDAFLDFVKYLDKHDCEIAIPEAGETFYLGSAKVTILYPDPGEFLSDNTSIALRIEYGETSFLFTGDCEIDDEAAILLGEYDLRSDVLKIAQHGSEHSTSDSFLSEVRPSYAVISVGGDNGYGFPTEEVLSRLQDAGVTLYRTDIQGDVHCVSDGTEVRFDVQTNPDFDTFLAAGGYLRYLDEQGAGEGENGEDGADGEVTYIANTNTMKFHKPSCSSVARMNEKNKWYFTGTRQELIDKGYQPCKNCNP